MKIFKTALLLVSTLFSLPTGAQVIDLGACEPDGLSSAGLKELKQVIGDARIVVIGEQEHGVGTDYENFAYLVKVLHEDMGFNVILQEYCFDYFGQVNADLKSGTSAQAYRKGMYWPQAKAKENDLLFDYIDAQQKTELPLYMEGFDPRLFQRKAVHAYYDTLLRNPENALLKADLVEGYLHSMDHLFRLEYKDSLNSLPEKTAFLANTEEIIQQMKLQAWEPRAIQKMRSLGAFAKNAWNLNGMELTDADRFFEREKQMAENIIWLAEIAYPNDKIIIRIHNGHAAKNTDQLLSRIPEKQPRKHLNVGSRLYERYGDTCMIIGSTYYSGTYCKWDYKEQSIPAAHVEGIETQLHEQGLQYAFVDLRMKEEEFYMFYCDFNSWIEAGEVKAPFAQLFDGLLFIDRVHLPLEKDLIKE